MAWALADMDRLRKVDPKQYGSDKKPDNGIIFLFGSWYQVFQKAPWVTAGLRWSASELGATVELGVPKEGRTAAYKGYLPGSGHGAAALIRPPGTVASLSLWRDLETFWESRAELFPPETVQGFAQLDTLAGQFFGGREFGADVLGQFDPHWRLIVAQQDHAGLKPQPDVKYPAFALVGELDSADSDFGQRFKVAFQAIVGISNVDGNQKKAAALELGSEEVDGITLATARYMVPRHGDSASVVPSPRYNFTPATAQVGKYLILSSSVSLARDLVKELKSKTALAELGETAVLEADGSELAKLLEINRSRLAMQLMLGRGEAREKAEKQLELGLALSATGPRPACHQGRPGREPDSIEIRARPLSGKAVDGMRASPELALAKTDPNWAWKPFEPTAARPGTCKASPTCTAARASPRPGRS